MGCDLFFYNSNHGVNLTKGLRLSSHHLLLTLVLHLTLQLGVRYSMGRMSYDMTRKHLTADDFTLRVRRTCAPYCHPLCFIGKAGTICLLLTRMTSDCFPDAWPVV
jgi:hypothetical protein